MNNILKLKKIIILPVLILTCFSSFNIPSILNNPFSVFAPQKVQADAWTGTDWANLVQNTSTAISVGISAGLQYVQNNWQSIVKNMLDAAAYQAAQLILSQMTEQIISWIKGGFHGSPSFAIDSNKLFNDLADAVAGDFARQIRGLAVCDFSANFKIDLTNSLMLSNRDRQKFPQKVQCPFDTIDMTTCDSHGKNCTRIPPGKQAAAFAQNFAAGGWHAYEASLQDSGNSFGLDIVTQQELSARAAQQKGTQQAKVAQGNGFLDLIDRDNCAYPAGLKDTMDGKSKDTDGNPISAFPPEARAAYEKAYCKTTTPGKVVEAQLTKSLGIDMDRVGFADNMNKIVAVFVQQLGTMAIQGVYSVVSGGPGQSTATGLYLSKKNHVGGVSSNTSAQSLSSMSPSDQAKVESLVVADPSVISAQDNKKATGQRLDDTTTALGLAQQDYNQAVEDLRVCKAPPAIDSCLNEQSKVDSTHATLLLRQTEQSIAISNDNAAITRLGAARTAVQGTAVQSVNSVNAYTTGIQNITTDINAGVQTSSDITGSITAQIEKTALDNFTYPQGYQQISNDGLCPAGLSKATISITGSPSGATLPACGPAH